MIPQVMQMNRERRLIDWVSMNESLKIFINELHFEFHLTLVFRFVHRLIDTLCNNYYRSIIIDLDRSNSKK